MAVECKGKDEVNSSDWLNGCMLYPVASRRSFVFVRWYCFLEMNSDSTGNRLILIWELILLCEANTDASGTSIWDYFLSASTNSRGPPTDLRQRGLFCLDRCSDRPSLCSRLHAALVHIARSAWQTSVRQSPKAKHCVLQPQWATHKQHAVGMVFCTERVEEKCLVGAIRLFTIARTIK